MSNIVCRKLLALCAPSATLRLLAQWDVEYRKAMRSDKVSLLSPVPAHFRCWQLLLSLSFLPFLADILLSEIILTTLPMAQPYTRDTLNEMIEVSSVQDTTLFAVPHLPF